MTTFINLESYIECCQYSNLFGEDSRSFIPNQNALPLAYRDFCKRHLSESFLPVPGTMSAQPEAPTPRTHSLPHQSIGLSVNDHRSEYIFIVREANTLALQSLQSRYLYANVYRYWSYAQQLEQFATSSKPLVIYDLDSFTPPQITPLTFEHYSNAPYAIPLIDTRSIKHYDTLKISESYEKIYDTICLEIASKIIFDLDLASDNLLIVTNYIKKINIFQNFNLISSDHISLILEINQHFYLYNLAIEDLVRITYSNLPILDLHTVISENSDFNFVLLSSYTTNPLIRKCVQQQFQNNLFMPNISNNFLNVWHQKVKNNFALYGQHLDRISFFVKSKGEDIKISLPERICYEGEQEVVVYGQYEKNGVLQESFPLKTKNVTLPFQINDESFLDGETGIEQIYQIENQFFDETPNIDIRIRFRIKPSLAPKLEVLDERQYILDSTLIDNVQIQVSDSETLGFIPMSQILKFRREKSINGLLNLDRDGFKHDIQSFSKVLCEINNPNYIDLVMGEINRFRSAWRERFTPIVVIPDLNNLILVLNSYKLIEGVLANILKQLYLTRRSSVNAKFLRNRAYSNLLLILGDSYVLTYDMNLDFLFNIDTLSKAKGQTIGWDHQLRGAAKVSCTKHRQSKFLSLFEKFTRLKNNNTSFYKTDVYIWGYARLLLWYVDMNDSSLLKTYDHQFLILINHCLTLNADLPHVRDYIRDALISLIYILTFREVDPLFIEKGSQAYNLSKVLCEKLRQTPISSKKANLDVPLNEFFDRLLDRTVTQEQVSNMIEID